MVLFTLASCINITRLVSRPCFFLISNFRCERRGLGLFALKTGLLVPQQVYLLLDNSQEARREWIKKQRHKQTQLMLPKIYCNVTSFLCSALDYLIEQHKTWPTSLNFSIIVVSFCSFLNCSTYLFAVHLTAVLLTQVYFYILYLIGVQIIELHSKTQT